MATVRLSEKDVSLCFDRLLVDARDDFWPDPYRYADLKLVKTEIVNLHLKELNATLSSNPQKLKTNPVSHWDVPKTHHVVRHAVLLNPHDRLICHVILNRLCRLIEPKLEKTRYSYRVTKPDDKYLFGKKGVNHWLDFKGDIATTFKESSDYQYLVSTDIAGFYEYIHLQDFRKQIENLTDNKAEPFVELLHAFLKNVSMSNHSGIPQNYDPSSYLCTAFLDFLDKDLLAKGFRHFRYVDDIKVACKNKRESKLSIIEIIHSLRSWNLNVQAYKTEIWHVNDDKFKNFVREFPAVLKKIDQAIERKDKRQIELLLPDLFKLTKEEMRKNQNDFDDRLFRACIRRILKCFRFRNIKFPAMDAINNKCVSLIQQMPERTDTFVDFLSLSKNRKPIQEKVFSMIKESVYLWQEMKLWELLVKADTVKIPQVLSFARKELSQKIEQDPVSNMLLLLLGKHGNYNDRQTIARMFNQSHSVHTKRHILVAIQEYGDRNMIYNQVLSGDDILLKAAVKYIRQLKTPLYVYEDKRIASDLAEEY